MWGRGEEEQGKGMKAIGGLTGEGLSGARGREGRGGVEEGDGGKA